MMTVKLAGAFGLNEAELVHVRWGSLLHDIGKMGVPDGILLKPDLLTEEEWDALHSDHPYRAAWPEGKVREHIRALSGIHFDPQVVDVFM